MRYLIILLLLSSCSATWHMNRAIKKDPTIVQPDTVTIIDTIKESVGSAIGVDSIIVDNDRLWAKVVGSGNLTLDYIIKPVVVELDTMVNRVVPPKTRQDKRNEKKAKKQEEKTNRVKAKQSGRTDRVVVRQENKKERHTAHWKILVMGIGIGFIISQLLPIIRKLIFK